MRTALLLQTLDGARLGLRDARVVPLQVGTMHGGPG